MNHPCAAQVAFAFVESALAAAARRGDWVLLDELNLAPGDVLQRLGPLLEGDFPRAHDALRVFGAMNPSGDAGKRELPPALRSRFTELFVEEPSDDGDLEAIAARRLAPLLGHRADGAVAAAAPGAARDAARACVALHRTLGALAAGGGGGPALQDGAGLRPRYSLRTLCRALDAAAALAGHCRKGGAAAALREGFELAYATQLVGDGPGDGRRGAADAVADALGAPRRAPGDDAFALVAPFGLSAGPRDRRSDWVRPGAARAHALAKTSRASLFMGTASSFTPALRPRG